MRAEDVLVSNKAEITDRLKDVLLSGEFRYETFGKDVEDHLSTILIKIFTKSGFIKNKTDYSVAKSKNDFPDFTLNTETPLAIEYKCGNKSRKDDSKWIIVKNSANDMGTINSWPKKIDKFGLDNIYGIFVVYDFNDRNKKICDVQIDRFYKFIGVSKNKILCYREKDGNLRPKDFDSSPRIKSPEDFTFLLNKTDMYRSRRIIKKHQANVKKIKSFLKRK